MDAIGVFFERSRRDAGYDGQFRYHFLSEARPAGTYFSLDKWLLLAST